MPTAILQQFKQYLLFLGSEQLDTTNFWVRTNRFNNSKMLLLLYIVVDTLLPNLNQHHIIFIPFDSSYLTLLVYFIYQVTFRIEDIDFFTFFIPLDIKHSSQIWTTMHNWEWTVELNWFIKEQVIV